MATRFTAGTHNPLMDSSAKIFVAGHRGLVGSAIVCQLRAAGYNNLLLRTRAELDLRDPQAVEAFMQQERPEYVFLAAAKVGGILANQNFPAEFIFENLSIETSVIHEAFRAGVRRLLLLGSSCIYPKHCPQPIKEEYLLTGPLEPTNRPYAIAKIAGIELCWAYNRQYRTEFLAAMPTNLYGVGDSYDLQTSHVIPALIRKFHEAKVSDASEVVVWGSGSPRREFLFSTDAADACIFLMNLPEEEFSPLVDGGDCPPLINVGCGEDFTIRELAQLVAEVVGFPGELVFDTSKPDGTPRKLLDVNRLSALGWSPKIDLRSGLTQSYQDFMRS
ncbi:MAG: GDP-L-fucose synthase [Acidobacteriaceae bacterium]|nr:GDP-L-fucose synthase [Acidobacteriaceae bacterium]